MRKVIQMKITSQLNQHIKDVSCRVSSMLRGFCPKLREYAFACLLERFLSQDIMEVFCNRHHDGAYLTFSYIVLGLSFHEGMTSKKPDRFCLKFLAYPLDEPLSDIFHNDRLERKGCNSSRLYQGASLQRQQSIWQASFRCWC